MLEEEKKMDKEQKHMKHITGMEKDGIANGKKYVEMGEIEANINERILEFFREGS